MASGSIINNIVCAPVEERDRLALENYEQTIVKLMDPEKISKMLVEKGVIDPTDRKQILVAQATGERNKMLLGKLMTRGPDAFKNYVNALTESRTKNHTKLAKLLQNEDHTASAAEDKPVDSRQKRITERIENHEMRLTYLEENVSEGRTEDEVESIRAELMQRHTELDELRKKLRTRDGELQEAREENKLLQKRIQSLEKKIVTLETSLKEQKAKVDTLTKQQQQDKRSIKALEDKNAKLESRIESSEKKMEKKFQDQEKRHHKELEEIKHILRGSAKLSDEGNSDGNSNSKGKTSTKKTTTTTASRAKGTTNTKSSTAANSRNLPKENVQDATTSSSRNNSSALVPKNRFQNEQASAPVPVPPKYFRAPRAVQMWKKSSTDPDKMDRADTAGQKTK